MPPDCETSLPSSNGVPGLCRQDSLLLHRVKRRIGFAQELLNRISVLGIDGETRANGKLWSIAVIGNALADAPCHQVGLLCAGLRQDHSKLVPAEARGSIYVPATGAQDIRQPAKRLAPDHMPVAVVDSFQSVHVKEQQGKLPAGAAATLDFPIKHIYEVALLGHTGHQIPASLTAQLILQPSPPLSVSA